MATTTSQLRSSILSQSLPPPSPDFLTTLLTSRQPPPPLPSLLATARARLLAADLTTATIIDAANTQILPSALFETGSSSSNVAEARLPRDVHLQVLDVEDLSRSRWDQVEDLEAVERGETKRGREVIRVSAETDGEDQQQQRPAASTGKATHRLVLQDRSGRKVYAIELRRVPRLDLGTTCIGEKVLLKAGTVVARGLVLLTPETCVLLGGKVEAWHKTWTEGRLARLKAAAAAVADSGAAGS